MDTNLLYRRVLCLTLLGSLTACYSERPLATPAPAPDTRVVATITDSGTVAMAETIGSGAVGVEGVVTSVDADRWSMRLLRVEHRDGRLVLWNRELVTFPSYALVNVTERTLDRKRSWAAGGILVTSAFLAARMFKLIGADTGSNPDPVPPH